MNKHEQLQHYISTHSAEIGKVIFFDPKYHHLFKFDFTAGNKELSPAMIADKQQFSAWIFQKMKDNGCRYGIGGYFEHRTLYNNTAIFNTTGETRNVHLGVDIWGDAETTVYNPIAGKVHSWQNNDNPGDYGPTIILEHDLDGLKLYSLYGHLSQESLLGLEVGMPMKLGEPVGHFGDTAENGGWPPHLHFQLMFDMEGMSGDHPGACRLSEIERYRQNIPDPNLILRFPESHIR